MKKYLNQYKKNQTIINKIYNFFRLNIFKLVIHFNLSKLLKFMIENSSINQKDILLLNVISYLNHKEECDKVLDDQGIPIDQSYPWEYYCLINAINYGNKKLILKSLSLNVNNEKFLIKTLINLIVKNKFNIINIIMNNININVSLITDREYLYIFNTSFKNHLYKDYNLKTINRIINYIVNDFKKHDNIISIIKIMKNNNIDYKKYIQ